MNTNITILLACILFFIPQAEARFGQHDEWEGDSRRPISQNKYLYTEANPVNGVDPSGRSTVGNLIGASVVVGVFSSIATSEYSPLSRNSRFDENEPYDYGLDQGIGDIISHCAWEELVPELGPLEPDTLKGIVEGLSIPIYKPLVGFPLAGNASKFTNAISLTGHFFYQKGYRPRVNFRFLGTNTPFRIAGRANAVVGSGFIAHDVTDFTMCVSFHVR